MQNFMIGPMCVTKEDFEQQLKENGLKFGYIKRLYEKWKDGDLTYFRIILEGSQFVIVTDDENSYPEIQEDSEKEIEPYSLEWLENLFYQSTIVGPLSYESLMPQLQMYISVKKAEQIDEKIKQNKCPYCQGVTARGGFDSDDYKYVTFFDRDENKFTFGKSHPDGYTPLGKFKINYCPFCRRKLEA